MRLLTQPLILRSELASHAPLRRAQAEMEGGKFLEELQESAEEA